jgi:hypothetical protein
MANDDIPRPMGRRKMATDVGIECWCSPSDKEKKMAAEFDREYSSQDVALSRLKH